LLFDPIGEVLPERNIEAWREIGDLVRLILRPRYAWQRVSGNRNGNPGGDAL
jgi:hypothetical protein